MSEVAGVQLPKFIRAHTVEKKCSVETWREEADTSICNIKKNIVKIYSNVGGILRNKQTGKNMARR